MTDLTFDAAPQVASPERARPADDRSPWVPALVLGTLYGITALSRVELFRYEGVDIHVGVAALFWLLSAGLAELHRRIT